MWIYYIVFSFFISVDNRVMVQDDLYGQWAVDYYQFFLNVSSDNPNYHLEIERNCLGSTITIDTNMISINSLGVCNFVPCNSLKILKEGTYWRLNDPNIYYKYPGAEVVEYEMISKELLQILGIKDEKVKYFDTNCFCENGDFTLKILIINTNKIALFSGIDITILTKISRIR